MRELVANKAYTGKPPTNFRFIFLTIYKLTAAGVCITLHPIDRYGTGLGTELSLVWPDSVFIGAIRLGISRIDTIYELHLAIAVIVTF